MWNLISSEPETYLLRLRENDGEYDFFLTDFKRVWKVKLNEVDMVESIQELNPRIEASHRALLDKTVTLLFKNEDISCIKGEESVTVKIESKIGGFPFIFNLKLDLMPENNVYKEIILPLSLMVHELRKRQEKLINIIKEKDSEIEDYKLGGAHLSHKFLKTKAFDEKLFIEEEVSEVPSDMISSPVRIFNSSLDLMYDSLMERITEYDQTNIKKEEVMEEDVPLELSQYPAASPRSPDLFDESENHEIKPLLAKILR
ncbi:hypothetical protein J437_LFUL011445 [Ladona fulva]|uniref:Non-homologous end-joining factor 1 n=1 Tax=Ladona fulva TaxID=123851 RepID=A0A8K0KDG8_LADFU|nr:hypothetical protein J437_LFUL011445 [Ladona fulva]